LKIVVLGLFIMTLIFFSLTLHTNTHRSNAYYGHFTAFGGLRKLRP